MITIEKSAVPGYFKVDGINYSKYNYKLSYDNIEAVEADINFSLCSVSDGKKIITSRGFAEIENGDSVAMTSWDELLLLLNFVSALSSNDVSVQDQHTPIIIAKMSKEVASTTLASLGAIGDYTFDVVSASGFIVGQYLSLFNIAANRFYLATVLDISTLTITVDSPLDFAYPIGSFVTVGDTSMDVNGSVTPVIYGLRNTEEAIGSAFDITRIIFSCLTATAADLSKFGDLAKLGRGIVLRRKDGIYRNIFNAKSNGELKNIMFDFDIETAVGQQQDGFTGRLTFGGQNKIGVTSRLEPGEDIQILIQDDLTGLDSFEIIAEGHTVE